MLLLLSIRSVVVMNSLLKQIKKRRLALGFKQADMQARVGIMRQVYQRIESKGNPRLATLELVATGLNSEIMLVPLDNVAAVKALLEELSSGQLKSIMKTESLEDDPWNDILDNDAADS